MFSFSLESSTNICSSVEMVTLLVGIVLMCQVKLFTASNELTDDSVLLTFEDNLVDRKFSPFSKTNLRLSRQSKIELSPLRTISSSHYQRLIEESRSNLHDYYSLKVIYKRQTLQNHVMTSIPMCLAVQAQFHYSITLFINENGFIVGSQMTTSNSTCHPSNISPLEDKNELVYRVTVRLQANDPGPQPDTQQFLEKLKREQEAKMHAQENDNRPFILKYWKYLLPVAVIFVLQTVFTDAGAAGNGGGGR